MLRMRSGSPPPRAVPAAATTTPIIAGAPGQLPPTPFNRRIRLLLDVVDQPDEVALAEQLLQERGWPVRRATPGDFVTPRAGRIVLVVEVRLYGAERGSVQAAIRQVEQMAALAKVGLWIREAAPVRPAVQVSATYFLHRRPSFGGRRMQALTTVLINSGMANVEGVLRLPEPADRAIAEEELSQHTLGSRPFDSRLDMMRAQPGGRGRSRIGDGPERRYRLRVLACLVTMVILGVVATGMAVETVPAAWKAAAILPAVLLAWPLGNWFAPATIPPRRRRRLGTWAFGLPPTVTLLAMGYVLQRAAKGGPGTQAATYILLPLGLLSLYGVWLALARSWFSRNASWLIPLSAAPAAFVIPWFGNLMYAVYLDENFGIPADSVPMMTGSHYAVALRPVLIATAFTLFFLGLGGWVRHFHGLNVLREMVWASITVLAVVYIGTTLLVGLESANNAAARAAAAAQAGHDPAPYFGLNGHLVCLQPTAQAIPIWNGPLPTDHAVLTFGGSGDRFWVWDPRREQAMSLRLEDVTVVPARSGSTCPTAAP
ncbi:hypothetical protein [Actinacidiphila bryophytorum]|uniref:hypothetical protein n=1 Tax=Actinacidiphila bryophytorum TaxID=1436133 RepID=UPI0021769AEB|nr:hypothetical protein [Actinacidiphila bryophytorum]UWE09043.1 hypothetical protein NYE86_10095 [Actinacidiphila bryophytorum]